MNPDERLEFIHIHKTRYLRYISSHKRHPNNYWENHKCNRKFSKYYYIIIYLRMTLTMDQIYYELGLRFMKRESVSKYSPNYMYMLWWDWSSYLFLLLFWERNEFINFDIWIKYGSILICTTWAFLPSLEQYKNQFHRHPSSSQPLGVGQDGSLSSLTHCHLHKLQVDLKSQLCTSFKIVAAQQP